MNGSAKKQQIIEQFLEKKRLLNEEYEKSLAAVDLEVEKLEKQPDLTIAERLHLKLCNHNHTDGCSWAYDGWKMPIEGARLHYLTMAQSMLELVNGDQFLLEDLINCIKRY